jgi:hypothetical protein
VCLKKENCGVRGLNFSVRFPEKKGKLKHFDGGTVTIAVMAMMITVVMMLIQFAYLST